MKIRITLMTENDNHIVDEITDEKLQEQVIWGWKMICKLFSQDGDKCSLEKIDIVER